MRVWIKNKIFWILTFLGIVGVAMAYTAIPVETTTPEHLKLKVPKEKILGVKEHNGIAVYRYVGKKSKKIDNEVIEKRTQSSITTKIGENSYATKSFGRLLFYKETDEWLDVNYATTTIKEFRKQTKNKFSFISKVFADTAVDDASSHGRTYNLWNNPQYAYGGSTNLRATEGTQNQKEDYYGYNFSAVSGTIDGIVAEVEARYGSGGIPSGSAIIGCELTWDGGSNWTSSGYDTGALSSSDSVKTLGGASLDWGHSWVVSEMATDKFGLYINADSMRQSTDSEVDQIDVTIYYTVGAEESAPDKFNIIIWEERL